MRPLDHRIYLRTMTHQSDYDTPVSHKTINGLDIKYLLNADTPHVWKLKILCFLCQSYIHI